jgi:predicted enzyme related to lactoylglutathione lyase
MASNPPKASHLKVASSTKPASKPKTASNPVRWFEIYVQDTQRAKAFYEAVFGVKLRKLGTPNMDYWSFPDVIMDKAGTSGAIVKMDGVASGGNSTTIYFGCEDCAVEAKRVVKAGGRIKQEKMSVGEFGFIALAFDTEGNMIGLHSMK